MRRYRLVRSAVAVTVSLTLGGCVTMARQQDGATFGNDYAELTFVLGLEDTVGLGTATTQEYRISAEQDFDSARRVTFFNWVNKEPEQFLVPVGEPVHVFAQITGLWGAPGITSSGSNTCLNITRLVPRPNTRYRIEQRGEATQGCLLAIVDAATGAVSPEAEMVRFPIDK